MKFNILALFIGSAFVHAQKPKTGQSLYDVFGNCQSDKLGSWAGCEKLGRGSNAQCCQFEEMGDESNTGKFCVSNSQRENKLKGVYRDKQLTRWLFTCKYEKKPQPKPAGPGGGGKGGKSGGMGEATPITLPPYSTLQDNWAEWFLWIEYLSSAFSFFGWPVMITMGSIWLYYL